MIALLLALSADCSALVPGTLPQPVEVAGSNCWFESADGSGNFGLGSSDGVTTYAQDGHVLGHSTLHWGAGRTSGWYSMDVQPPPGATWSARMSSIAPDGRLLAQRELPASVSSRYFVLPNDDALLFLQTGDATSWRFEVMELSPSLTSVGETKTLLSGQKSNAPPQYEVWYGTSVDGMFLLSIPGWVLPPFRNNQRIARWFDPSGVPLTPWFVALDNALEGRPSLALPDGGIAMTGRFPPDVEVFPHAAATSPAPDWAHSDWQQTVFVLRDRIVTVEQPTDACEVRLTIRAPAGNICGVMHVPHSLGLDNICSGVDPFVGADGTVFERNAGGACHVRWWPKLLGAASR